MKLRKVRSRIGIFEYLYKISEQNIRTDTIIRILLLNIILNNKIDN
jgi:hypothetical protein